VVVLRKLITHQLLMVAQAVVQEMEPEQLVVLETLHLLHQVKETTVAMAEEAVVLALHQIQLVVAEAVLALLELMHQVILVVMAELVQQIQLQVLQ
tara:strand:- start:192 stop:479 length:288 start_codon:yes stop_codon:yes gene_type:complete